MVELVAPNNRNFINTGKLRHLTSMRIVNGDPFPSLLTAEMTCNILTNVPLLGTCPNLASLKITFSEYHTPIDTSNFPNLEELRLVYANDEEESDQLYDCSSLVALESLRKLQIKGRHRYTIQARQSDTSVASEHPAYFFLEQKNKRVLMF